MGKWEGDTYGEVERNWIVNDFEAMRRNLDFI